MKERVKCPRCGVEYDMLNDAASEAMDWLCAACWCGRHEKNIGEGGEREVRRSEKARREIKKCLET
jgi:transcription initiation factor TFIIIB Brf1 subunit/transcription initiation factor TFIIB